MNTSFCHLLISFFVASYNRFEHTFRGEKKSPENLTDLVRPPGSFYIFSVLSGCKGTLSPQILMRIQ